MSVRRCALFAVLVALAAVALAPATASSAGKNSTKIVVSLKFPAFHGTLTSPRQACLGSRKIKLYRLKSGSKKLLGSDQSEDNGKWAIPVKKLTSGSYFATVGQRGNCKSAKSKVLSID